MSRYAEIEADLHRAITTAPDGDEAMTRLVQLLKERIPSYTWVGIYLRRGDELHLGPFLGAPSPHTRIPLGRGICGAAATERRTIVVDDVHAFPDHIACDSRSRSEIVIPVFDSDGRLAAVLDVDSERPGAFDEADRSGLEAICADLLRLS